MATISLLAGAASSAALAGAIVAFAAALGHALLPARARSRAVLAVPLGLSAGTLLLGLVTWLWGTFLGTGTLAVPWILLAVVAALRAREWLAASRRLGLHLARLAFATPLAAVTTLASAATLAPLLLQLSTPLADSDGLKYHVALPKLFLMQGRVSWYPWDVTGSFPQTTEMLYLACVAAGRPAAAKFLHAGFALLAMAAVALAVHSSRRTRAAAPLAIAFLAASPVFTATAGAAFVEHAASLHVAVALLLLSRGGGGALVALPLAAAFATKMTSAPAVAVLLVAAAASAPPGKKARRFALGVLAIAVAWLPFAVRNVVHAKDPFFPLGYGLLGLPVPGVSAEGMEWATRYGRAAGRVLHLAFLPGAAGVRADDVLGLHVLALVPLAALALRRAPRLAPFVLPALAYVPLYLLLAPPARYLSPGLVGLAGAGAIGLSLLGPRLAIPLGLLLALPGAVGSASFLATSQRPLDVLSGRLAADAWLSREVPGYRAARALAARGGGRGGRGGREADRGDAVMAIDFPAPFYLARPWVAEGVVNVPPLKQWLGEGCGADELLLRTRALGVRWILVTPGYGGGSPLSLLALTAPTDRRGVETLLAFRSRLRLVSTVDGVDLWEVPPASPLP